MAVGAKAEADAMARSNSALDLYIFCSYHKPTAPHSAHRHIEPFDCVDIDTRGVASDVKAGRQSKCVRGASICT